MLEWQPRPSVCSSEQWNPTLWDVPILPTGGSQPPVESKPHVLTLTGNGLVPDSAAVRQAVGVSRVGWRWHCGVW